MPSSSTRGTILLAALILLIVIAAGLLYVTGHLSGGTLSSVSGDVTSAVVSAISSAGYFGVFGLMFLEATSLPVPSEVVLPFAGYLVSTGELDFWVTVALAVAAGVLGGLVDYYIGLVVGMRVLSNYSSRFFVSKEQLQRMDALFAKHGSIVIFLSRLVPGIRTLASFPAGAARMNLPRFVLFTVLGCLVFDTALVYVGDYLGSNWDSIKAVGTLEIGATALVIILAAWVFLRMHRRSEKQVKAA